MRAFDDQRIGATINYTWSRDIISGRGQPQNFSRALVLYTQPPLSVNPGYAPALSLSLSLSPPSRMMMTLISAADKTYMTSGLQVHV